MTTSQIRRSIAALKHDLLNRPKTYHVETWHHPLHDGYTLASSTVEGPIPIGSTITEAEYHDHRAAMEADSRYEYVHICVNEVDFGDIRDAIAAGR